MWIENVDSTTCGLNLGVDKVEVSFFINALVGLNVLIDRGGETRV